MTDPIRDTTNCRFEMILRGDRAIPRSCPACGLGGCKKGLPDPYRQPSGPPPNTGSGVMSAPGCPCPAGANLTCEHPRCGRKPSQPYKVL